MRPTRARNRVRDGRRQLCRLIAPLWTAAALALVLLPVGSARGAVSCPDPTTTAGAGTALHIAACAGEVVVASPAVRVVYGSPEADVIRAGDNVEVIYGGEGNDTIYAVPQTTVIEGGAGEDKIYGEAGESETGEEPGAAETSAAPVYEPAGPSYEPQVPTDTEGPRATASTITPVECRSNPCLGGDGAQLIRGGPGNDEIFGGRGNDEIYGEGGEDALYGGIGNDILRGGEGADYISGGNGADTIYGESGNDLVQGDGTTDTIYGGSGASDTLSFATGVTPGFEGAYPSSVKHVEGFPEVTDGEGRGVYVRLDGAATTCGSYQACDGGAGLGGGDDEIVTSEIENVIGTPFADIIVGSKSLNRIYGGGGGDVIIGGGGGDELFGGADGDYIEDSGAGTVYGGKGANNCVGVTHVNECGGTEARVTQPEAAKLGAGLMSVRNPVVSRDSAYVIGSSGNDEVEASLSGPTITFTSTGSTRFSGESEGCTYLEEGRKARCVLPPASQTLDAVVMAGLGGDDHLTVGGGFPLSAEPILLGGEGNDKLVGSNATEDVLVDGNGNGNDTLEGRAQDDWLTNNGGVDLLEGGGGSDLILSTTTCDGDTIYGGEAERSDGAARNVASWAKLPAPGGVTAMLEEREAGSYYDEETKEAACTTGEVDTLLGIDDLEGSNQSDALFGNEAPNMIVGHLGEDVLYGEGGDDEIEAQDGEKDKIGGGEGEDLCIIDTELDERSGCEHTEPPLIATSVATPTVEPHNGTPGSVTVKGGVSAGGGSLSGRYVNVNYSKEEGGAWVLKSTQHPVLNGSGAYGTSEGVGVGSWRVKVVFPEQGPFLASESGYVTFSIAE